MNKRLHKYLALSLALAMSVSAFTGCTQTDNKNVQGNEEKAVERSQESNYTLNYRLISGEEAANILAADDDYTIKLSKFDYASKFKSEKPLNEEERKEVLSKYVLEWTDDQKAYIEDSMKTVTEKLAALNIELPEILFIMTDPEDEGGAAYTRENAIIFKPYYLSPNNKEGFNDVLVHEIFHVFSRANKDLRDEMYGVIGYHKCEELVVPAELKDLTIGNPDAPDNNFYINGTYNDKEYSFIPLIYSTMPYDIEEGGSFFQTLKDDLLAVEIKDGVPEPIYVDGELLVVTKEQVVDYYEKIGDNTQYTFHPEETMADNFVFLVFGREVSSPWVVEGLAEVLKK